MQTATQRGLQSVKFLIDRTASRFTVQAFATGLLSSFGHNPTIGIRDFAGEVQFTPETYEAARLHVTLQTADLEVLDEMKTDDRKKIEQAMFDDVLQVQQYPTAVYDSTQISVQKLGNDLLLARIVGELTFHGNTQSLPMDARVTDMGAMLRASGEFSLRQSDYGIKPFSFAGGALRLKDELKFKFEIMARKQDDAQSTA
jgi:polyisoprenoid-binding protein YceI